MSKMIEVKTAELIGMALDWAAAQALGYSEGEDAYCNPAWFDGDRYVASKNQWRPSTDWSQGGPLIDKHGVALSAPYTLDPTWDAYLYSDDGTGDFEAEGCSTALIAICRVIVTSKLGDVVQVPAELLERAQ